MAGIADLKARLAEIENEIKAKTGKAYTDLGRAVAAAYSLGSNSITVTEEIREILEELLVGTNPRVRGKRVTAKAVTARLVDVFGVEATRANSVLAEFEKAKLKKFLPRIAVALDDIESKKETNSKAAFAAIRSVYSEMGGSASPTPTQSE